MTTPPSARHWTGTARLAAAMATLAAGAAWVGYLRQGLVLAHYDAKAHLVVARRVIDSLTPGWEQIGAVWLPLPHLINLLPVQLDLFYRTGAFGSLVSVVCFGITAWAAARLVLAVTGSKAGALASAALLVLNPSLLYLHTTPMTEPLSVAAACLVVLWLHEWLAKADLKVRLYEHASSQGDVPRIPAKLGWALFAAAWTRYDAWLVAAAAIGAAACALARLGLPWRRVAHRCVTLAAWPTTAVVLFLVHSRMTTGGWFVAGGFYEPDPYYAGLFWRSLIAVWWGTHQLSGFVIETVALATAAVLAYRGLTRRADRALLVPIALFAAGALPFYAFYEGHPYRVRYMVPVAAASAVFCGIAVGLARRHTLGPALAAFLTAATIVESPPWDRLAPMLVEAQWDVPRSLERRRVTACLTDRYRGERIFASMASLAHYMQELSRDGFDIADFVHEGNGPLWLDGFRDGAARQAGWMLAEEQSEGGDVLTRRIREDPRFARGMTRACEGGGVALYERATQTP